MKLITRDTDYAIRALMVMAKEPEKRMHAGEIGKKTGIPRPFMRKILQMLGGRGIVASYKGTGGGFGLKKKPEAIKIRDIMFAFQGALKFNECSLKKKDCPNRFMCKLKKRIDKIGLYVNKEIGAISIKDVM